MNPEHINKSNLFKALSRDFNERYKQWYKEIFREDIFDRKTMELIALAAACAIKCSYCIEAHSQKARIYGASEEEIAKVIQIASAVGAGSIISYGVEGLKE